jgi:uncharacterized protein (TIGR01777 family)
MRILVTGGTGFIGTALVNRLLETNHSVTVLTRQQLESGDRLDYVSSLDTLKHDEKIDAVINLAGASLADRRWTRRYKQEIFSSRLDTTRDLVALLSRLEQTPATLLSGSAIGYYGHHGDESLDENGESLPGFAQDLCKQWESAALQARDLGVRVCLLRLGVVLDAGGGAFTQMDRPFRLGIANWMGHGRQWLSWIHRADVIAAIEFLLANETLSGPFNLTAPDPVTSRGFCEIMKRHRRTLLTAPVPALVMRLMVGEMADELLLNGQRVMPASLQDAGFTFRYPTLDDALKAIG